MIECRRDIAKYRYPSFCWDLKGLEPENKLTMAQAGMHGLAGMVVRKWTPNQEWLMLGIVLGNLFPDTDNLAVAYATVAALPTHGLHRTFTHSVFTIAAFVVIFSIASWVVKQSRWRNLGVGLGIGVLMHILLDLLMWFNGVQVLWPIPSWVNLWSNITPPEWWSNLMMPAEFLFFALFFVTLYVTARRQSTNPSFLSRLRVLTIVQLALFVALTVLVYVMDQGFRTIYGPLYLVSLGLAIWITIRMRETVEAVVDR